MMKTNKSLGLYIHIPFCLQKCHYCDFYSEAGSDAGLRAKYVDALCTEIRYYGGQLGRSASDGGRLVDTIFIGGGTPSILEAEQTVRIVSTVFDSFRVSESAEISMECNPATLTAEKLKAYRKAGISPWILVCFRLWGVHTVLRMYWRISGWQEKPDLIISTWMSCLECPVRI